ncbi:MAG: hypothetical protein IJ342_00995 [Muribaculaceae bacterium]|nr:hypothetical protein [Muribaculaceae bacterium]
MRKKIKNAFLSIKSWLATLSFRTGVILLIVAVLCYVISFAQMLGPFSATTKGVLWFIFFGLAKTAQYSGLAVLGATGISRIKKWWQQRKNCESK